MAVFLLLGLVVSGVWGYCNGGASAAAAWGLGFLGGCVAFALLIAQLAYLHALALALVYHVPRELERDVQRMAGGLVRLFFILAMGGGIACKYLGSDGALRLWMKALLCFTAAMVALFIVMYVVEFVLQRYRRRRP